MIEEKKQKKNKVIKGIALLGLFLMIFGISYALFQITLNGKKTNKIKSAKFDVRLTTTDGIEEKDLPDGTMGINIEGSNAVPMTQEEGMSLESYKFVVQNRGSVEASYKLTLEDIEGITNSLEDQYIRYNLIEKDYYDYREYHEGDFSRGIYSTELNEDIYDNRNKKSPKLSETIDRVLDETTLMPNECIEYTLNLWVDYDATTEQASEKEFSAKIKVDATQASIFSKGKAGENIDYTYYKDGTLILTGTGAMNGLDMATMTYNNNVGPITDILYNYLILKGHNLSEINADNLSAFLSLNSLIADKKGRYDTMGHDHYSDTSIDYCFALEDYGSTCDVVGDIRGLASSADELKAIVHDLEEVPFINRIVIDEGITSISSGAFFEINSYMVSFPSTLTTIETYAFDANNVILNIPNSVSSVGESGLSNQIIIYIDNTKEYVDSNWTEGWNSVIEENITYLR